MGSTLSIVNNTPDVWICKIGSDDAAIGIFGIVAAVVGALATGFVGIGAAAGAAGIAITGTATAITAAASAAGTVATVAGFLQVVVDNSVKDLIKDGFWKIDPGKDLSSGSRTLSLWQQGTCIRHRKISDTEFAMDKLFMRPIFTGPVDHSNLEHDIQFWLDKWGVETTPVFVNVIADSSPTALPTSNPTLPPKPFVCEPCFGVELINLDSRAFIPGQGFKTCREIRDAANKGEINEDQCPLISQFLGPCGCPGVPLPDFARDALGTQNSVDEIQGEINAIKASIDGLGTSVQASVGDIEGDIIDIMTSVDELEKSIDQIQTSIIGMETTLNQTLLLLMRGAKSFKNPLNQGLAPQGQPTPDTRLFP
jgi:hypothetical protein